MGGCGSDFLLRYRTGAFNLYSGERERVDVTDFFHEPEAGDCGEVTLYYKVKEAYKPIRLCAMRKTEEAEREGIERLKVMNRMKSHGKPPSEAQLANNRYVIVATSLLEADACLILQLYRFRWQIELVFKRLKSLFGYNQIPSKVDVSAKAWFYGKLLLAAFCETRANKARFSPWADSPIG
jgi:IS4 transposase